MQHAVVGAHVHRGRAVLIDLGERFVAVAGRQRRRSHVAGGVVVGHRGGLGRTRGPCAVVAARRCAHVQGLRVDDGAEQAAARAVDAAFQRARTAQVVQSCLPGIRAAGAGWQAAEQGLCAQVAAAGAGGQVVQPGEGAESGAAVERTVRLLLGAEDLPVGRRGLRRVSEDHARIPLQARHGAVDVRRDGLEHTRPVARTVARGEADRALHQHAGIQCAGGRRHVACADVGQDVGQLVDQVLRVGCIEVVTAAVDGGVPGVVDRCRIVVDWPRPTRTSAGVCLPAPQTA